ncbi:hypothetical protein HY065_02070, partial [Candidatus Berkelbacteria bacterium]|nr:hypothetical protein [Candidatus Berkelbacteria bacterium]
MATKFQPKAGTSGYRGDTGKEIGAWVAERITRAYIALLMQGREIQKRLTLVVAHDQRAGADALAHVIAGVAAACGVDVLFVGQVTTGMLTVFMQGTRTNGALYVTGSHMPAHRIGIIPLLPNAHYAGADVTDYIDNRFKIPNGNDFIAEDMAEAMDMGEIKNMSLAAGNRALMGAYTKVASETINVLVPETSESQKKTTHMHILVDIGNGTAGNAAACVLDESQLKEIFTEP